MSINAFEVYCGPWSGEVTFYQSGKNYYALCPAYERPKRISRKMFEKMNKIFQESKKEEVEK